MIYQIGLLESGRLFEVKNESIGLAENYTLVVCLNIKLWIDKIVLSEGNTTEIL